ncbi:MAG: hypothetical protein ACRD12_03075 [Acidimicrobiales bacterium]
MSDTADASDVLDRVLGHGGWVSVARLAITDPDADHALGLAHAQHLARLEVRACLHDEIDGQPAIMPALRELLAAVFAVPGNHGLDPDLVLRFQAAIAQLLPAGFVIPGRRGTSKALISHPATAVDAQVAARLPAVLALPSDPNLSVTVLPAESEQLVVVLMRTNLAITDVDEARELLVDLAAARRQPQPEDHLEHRQRTGHDTGWMLTTRTDRVAIMHRFLSVLWDGLVEIEGDPESPHVVRVRQRGSPTAQPLELRLRPFGEASSWGDLLRAYEEQAALHERIEVADACAAMMTHNPQSLADGTVKEPSDLYRQFAKLAGAQVEILERYRHERPSGGQTIAAMTLHVWQNIVPAAVRMPFDLPVRFFESHEGMADEFGVTWTWTLPE